LGPVARSTAARSQQSCGALRRAWQRVGV